jgi:hypothetical protein
MEKIPPKDIILMANQPKDIILTANMPQPINVPKGIDYFNTIIHIRYTAGEFNRLLNLSFRTRDKAKFETSLILGARDGEIDYQPYSDFSQGDLAEKIELFLSQRNSDLIFYELVLSTAYNFTIQIWTEDQVGGFM